MPDDIQKELEDIEAMFVQVAKSYTADGAQVTFHGLAPATLFFSDRPQRVVGHLTAQQFVDEWGKGENSFAVDPPNAVISFLEAGDEAPEDAIVVLKDPRLDGTRSRTATRCSKAPCRRAASTSPCSSTRSDVRSRRSRSPA